MKSARHRGTTLIEVLFGLVILATLLVAVVMARGRFLRGAADAQRKEKLIAALDSQLGQWFASDTPNVPMNATGPLDALPGATWNTQTQSNAAAAAISSKSVRVEAVDNHSPPLSVLVEVLVHDTRLSTP